MGCKRCVIEKNFSWLAAVLCQFFQTPLFIVFPGRGLHWKMKVKVFQVFSAERQCLQLSSFEHHEVKTERVPHSIGVKLHFSAGPIIENLLAWVHCWRIAHVGKK